MKNLPKYSNNILKIEHFFFCSFYKFRKKKLENVYQLTSFNICKSNFKFIGKQF